jgi:hypothetical protein
MRERAALVATTVERLDRRDVATIVGMHGGRLERLIARARRRATGTGASIPDNELGRDGPIANRIRAIATRAVT